MRSLRLLLVAGDQSNELFDLLPGNAARTKQDGDFVDQRQAVDSIPTWQGPPSRMQSMRFPRDRRMWSAVVGEIPVKRFALGAATGTCAASISAKATGCAGIRTPTVGNPAVTMSGTSVVLGTTRVSGPGQNRSAKMRAASGHDEASWAIISRLLTCTMIGLVPGRPLTSKILATALASSAFAPTP